MWVALLAICPKWAHHDQVGRWRRNHEASKKTSTMTNNFYLLRLYNFVMFIRIGLHSPSYFRSCKENVMFTIINILKSSTLFCLVVFCIIAYLPKRSILSFFWLHPHYIWIFSDTLFIVISRKFIINPSYDGIFYKHRMCIFTSFTKREEKM